MAKIKVENSLTFCGERKAVANQYTEWSDVSECVSINVFPPETHLTMEDKPIVTAEFKLRCYICMGVCFKFNPPHTQLMEQAVYVGDIMITPGP